MKLSSNNNNAVLGLLSVLLAFPSLATAVKTRISSDNRVREAASFSRRLADCTADDFLITEFVMTDQDAPSTIETQYEGCYEIADTLDGNNFYKIDGDLTEAGGAFYAGDNNGGNTVASWYFADVAADTTAENATDSFLCFDLDLGPVSTTHPVDVTSWGLYLDENVTNVVRECDITMTCGCVTESPTSSPVVAEDDDEPVGATEEDAAFAIAVGGTHFVLVLSTVVLVAANWL